MVIRKVRILSRFAAVASLLLLVGCAGTVKNMAVVPPGEVVNTPSAGKSMVVFMRPSTMGFAIQSSVFEVKDDDIILAGIVAAKKQVAYELDSGKHLFMVIGESADFMSADLEPNKTYYAFVTPRMGLWKARFSLKPIHADEFSLEDLQECMRDCEWVRKSAESENWAESNMADLLAKRHEYYPEWMGKGPNGRPTLYPQDGK